MSPATLILAAHGSRHDPAANAVVRSCAARVAALGPFHPVIPAFRLGAPTFATVLDTLPPSPIVVVPFMTSAGYFCEVFLPSELRLHRTYAQHSLTITSPVGIHPRVAGLVRQRVRRLLDSHALSATESSVWVVGHGTPRHAASRTATEELAESLGKLEPNWDVRPAFLEEGPRVEQVSVQTVRRNTLIVPFLIGGGFHATSDILQRVGMNPDAAAGPPYVAPFGRGVRILDLAVGAYEEMARIVIELATSGGPLQPVAPAIGVAT